MLIRTVALPILQTLAYFNLFRMPLTDWEIYKNLFQPDRTYTFQEIKEALLILKNKGLQFQEGFYFFHEEHKENLVLTRKQRYLLANGKMRIAKKYICLLSLLPFIKAIFICNDLSSQNAPDNSDIDLAIITANNRIWTARFFSVLLIKLLGKRPSSKTHKNKICLSFYLTENNLNLQSIAYPNDIHFIYWLNQFLPIYDSGNFAEQFFTANAWTKAYLPNIIANNTTERWLVHPLTIKKKLTEKLLNGRIGNYLESILKKLQLGIMPEQLQKLSAEQNTNVLINDQILKFHTKDNRLLILHEWEKLVAEITSKFS